MKKFNYQFVEPECGFLACGTTGKGRMAEIEDIFEKTSEVLTKRQILRGKKILITAGGTKEKILCQYAADASNRAVYAGPVEATAIGNIAMQTIATGELKDIYEARDIVRNSFEIKVYEPNHTSAWDEAYQRFLNICK